MNTDQLSEDKKPEHELGYFVRLANNCCNEALEVLKAPLRTLADIDALYMRFIGGAGGIKPATAAVLLLNAHASFRAAIRLALSGQLLPVFMALRGSIESALYANAIVVNPDLDGVWLKRDSDEQSRKACRDEFTIGKMFQYLEKAQDKEFSEHLRFAYDSTIDFGAHPNSHLLVRSIHIEKLPTGQHSLDFAYIHGADSFDLRQSVVACAEVGLSVFYVALICAATAHPESKELEAAAAKLRESVPKLIAELGLSSEK